MSNGYFASIPVRFFVVGYDLGDYETDMVDIVEVNEHEFLAAEGKITMTQLSKKMVCLKFALRKG